MSLRFPPTLAMLALGSLLSSCSTTIPTAKDMDTYYEKATRMAQADIRQLDEEKARGEISQQEYDEKTAQINARIARRATEMAWARHELSESQMRAQGIPTGDQPVRVDASATPGSLYRPYTDKGSSLDSQTSPYGGAISTRPNSTSLQDTFAPPPRKAPPPEYEPEQF